MATCSRWRSRRETRQPPLVRRAVFLAAALAVVAATFGVIPGALGDCSGETTSGLDEFKLTGFDSGPTVGGDATIGGGGGTDGSVSIDAVAAHVFQVGGDADDRYRVTGVELVHNGATASPGLLSVKIHEVTSFNSGSPLDLGTEVAELVGGDPTAVGAETWVQADAFDHIVLSGATTYAVVLTSTGAVNEGHRFEYNSDAPCGIGDFTVLGSCGIGVQNTDCQAGNIFLGLDLLGLTRVPCSNSGFFDPISNTGTALSFSVSFASGGIRWTVNVPNDDGRFFDADTDALIEPSCEVVQAARIYCTPGGNGVTTFDFDGSYGVSRGCASYTNDDVPVDGSFYVPSDNVLTYDYHAAPFQFIYYENLQIMRNGESLMEVRTNNLNFLYYIVAPKTAVVRDETLTIYDSPNVNVFLVEQQVTVGAAPTSEDSVVLHMDLTLRFRVQEPFEIVSLTLTGQPTGVTTRATNMPTPFDVATGQSMETGSANLVSFTGEFESDGDPCTVAGEYDFDYVIDCRSGQPASGDCPLEPTTLSATAIVAASDLCTIQAGTVGTYAITATAHDSIDHDCSNGYSAENYAHVQSVTLCVRIEVADDPANEPIDKAFITSFSAFEAGTSNEVPSSPFAVGNANPLGTGGDAYIDVEDFELQLLPTVSGGSADYDLTVHVSVEYSTSKRRALLALDDASSAFRLSVEDPALATASIDVTTTWTTENVVYVVVAVGAFAALLVCLSLSVACMIVRKRRPDLTSGRECCGPMCWCPCARLGANAGSPDDSGGAQFGEDRPKAQRTKGGRCCGRRPATAGSLQKGIDGSASTAAGAETGGTARSSTSISTAALGGAASGSTPTYVYYDDDDDDEYDAGGGSASWSTNPSSVSSKGADRDLLSSSQST